MPGNADGLYFDFGEDPEEIHQRGLEEDAGEGDEACEKIDPKLYRTGIIDNLRKYGEIKKADFARILPEGEAIELGEKSMPLHEASKKYSGI